MSETKGGIHNAILTQAEIETIRVSATETLQGCGVGAKGYFEAAAELRFIATIEAQAKEIERLQEGVKRMEGDLHGISKEMECCHTMLDWRYGEHDDGTVSGEMLALRLRDHLQRECPTEIYVKKINEVYERFEQWLLGSGDTVEQPSAPFAELPKREWACNRCMYSWDGNGGWCPMCGEPATHGEAFNDNTTGGPR